MASDVTELEQGTKVAPCETRLPGAESVNQGTPLPEPAFVALKSTLSGYRGRPYDARAEPSGAALGHKVQVQGKLWL